MSTPRKLNPFALRAMLKRRDEDVAALRKCVRLLIPIAQHAIGGYPPEVMEDMKKDLTIMRRILKETR